MNDRRLGYLILSALTLAVAISTLYVARALLFPAPELVLAFDRIGAIRIEDPLKMDGVAVGKIKSIQPVGEKVYVTIELYDRISVREGYAVQSMDQGIMGDRVIVLKNGDMQASRIPPGDTLVAHFVPGVSEAVGQAYKLKNLVTSYLAVTDRLLGGVDSGDSFIDCFQEFVVATDTLSQRLMTATVGVTRELDDQLGRLDTMVGGATDMTRALSDSAPEFLSAITAKIDQTLAFAHSLESALDTLDNVLARANRPQGLINGSAVRDLHSTVTSAQSLLEEVQKEGVKLKLQFMLGR